MTNDQTVSKITVANAPYHDVYLINLCVNDRNVNELSPRRREWRKTTTAGSRKANTSKNIQNGDELSRQSAPSVGIIQEIC